MDTMTIGIRYEPLQGVTQVVTGNAPNKEEHISMKHWVLVFSGPAFGFRIEMGPGPGENQEVTFQTHPCPSNYDAYKIGTFQGEWSDLAEVLQVHPQRNTIYSPTFNNCQHFVASYLLFLQAYANSYYSKSFIIQYKSRYDEILKVFNKDQQQFYHDSNPLLGSLNFAPVTAAGAAAGTAIIAAEATVTSTVAAGGILGWLGATTTVVAPAAYAGVAAFCAPLAVAGTGVAGVAYWMRRKEWKNKTLFDNPLVHGFPQGYFPALSCPERRTPLSAKENFLSTHSALKESVISTGVVGVAGYLHNPAAVGAQRAAQLFQLAGKYIA